MSIKAILYHGHKGQIDSIIQRVCQDTETHFAFLHKDGSVSDARPWGGFQRRQGHNYFECVADIYTLNLTYEQQLLLDAAIKKRYGTKYDWWGLIGYFWYKLFKRQFDMKKAGFCSEIGVDCIRDTGAKCFDGLDSGMIAPADIPEDDRMFHFEKSVNIWEFKIQGGS